MHRTTVSGIAIGAIVTAALVSTIAVGGPLTPPAGPVQSTDTALRQTEPRLPVNAETTLTNTTLGVFEITQSGSYYLTGDITTSSSLAAIAISGQDVTLDLNGFTIRGLAQGAGPGVNITDDALQVTVRNGHFSGTRGAVVSTTDTRVLLQDLSARNCNDQGGGVFVTGSGIVERCVATDSSADGFVSTGTVVYRDCLADGVQGVGFLGSSAGNRGATYRGCVSVNNATGFVVGSGRPQFFDCRASDNATRGFNVTEGRFYSCEATGASGPAFFLFGGVLHDCTAGGIVDAFVAGGGTVRFESCTAINFNGTGFFADGGNVVAVDCLASGGFDGFAANDGSTISATRCTATENADDGFQINVGSIAVDCVAQDNRFGFFLAGGGGTVRGCDAIRNTEEGFLAISAGNLIEGNTAIGNTPNYSFISSASLAGPIVASSADADYSNPRANVSFNPVVRGDEAPAKPE